MRTPKAKVEFYTTYGTNIQMLKSSPTSCFCETKCFSKIVGTQKTLCVKSSFALSKNRNLLTEFLST